MNQTQQNNNSQKDFEVKINSLIEFFDYLAFHLFSGKINSFITPQHSYELGTELIDSSVKTLKSIKDCCYNGSFSDANCLARKFRDDLLLYLYILEVKENRKYFPDDNVNFKNDISEEEFVKIFENLIILPCANDDEKSVESWFANTVEQMPQSVKKCLSFSHYMEYLKKNTQIVMVMDKFNVQSTWSRIQKRLNDFTHNNGIKHTQYNLLRIDHNNYEIPFKNIMSILEYISAFFVTTLILVDGPLISSSDYVDHLDVGLEPPEDSQYWIAKFVQDFLDEYVIKIHPELKLFLKENNKYGMVID